MRWDNWKCKISSDMTAEVWPSFGEKSWCAIVRNAVCDHSAIWFASGYAAESDAKAAVCHWIGKTMAQFSNALAAGCNEQDDGA